MSSGGISRQDFADFLARVTTGKVKVEDWNRFAVTHYADSVLEELRRELVRECLERSQCSACVVPPGLELVADDLRERLLNAP